MSDLEYDSIETMIDADIDRVVEFVMNTRNIAKFSFKRDEGKEIEFISHRQIRVYDPMLKTTTTCNNYLLRKENVALVEHCVKFDKHDITWDIFLLIKEVGRKSHVVFGWYISEAVKSYMCETYSWPEFNHTFMKNEVATSELEMIKKLLEEETRDEPR